MKIETTRKMKNFKYVLMVFAGGGFGQKGGGTPSCGNRRNAFRNRPHEPPQGAGWLTPNGTDSAPAPRAILAKLLDSIADIIRIFRLIFYFKNTCIWL
ncbi:hypothetical protein P3B99_000755 [Opitutia bacterium KCR 482]|nr:hypothetical protein [Opitutae bacterium KCR 482]